MTQDIVDQVEAYKQKILDGTIVVPTEPRRKLHRRIGATAPWTTGEGRGA